MPTTRGRTLSEAVVDRILELVRTEGLGPGDRIPSELLLLVDVPSDLTAGSLMVARTTQAINALYEARRVLEVALASMAATRATPRDLTLMRQEIARLAAAPDDWELIVGAGQRGPVTDHFQ